MIEGENIKIYIGEIKEEDDTPKGPTPKPSVTELREWDRILSRRYKPKYNPIKKTCFYCAYGPCDLNAKRRGACGIDLETQLSRDALSLALTGLAAHAAHARHMLDHIIGEGGKNKPINIAENTEIETPLITLITGHTPKTIGDLIKPIEYVEEQITQLLSSLHVGQESSNLDFESKILHAGMVDHLSMEIADVLQVSAYNLPKGDPKPPLVEIGFGSVDQSKPVVLCIGHNVVTGIEVVDYARENEIDVEIAGLCCTSHDLARYDSKAKVVGPLSYQLPYVRSGVADVIILDEQCIRVDNIKSAETLGTPVITTSEKNAGGFQDMSDVEADVIVEKLVNKKITGAFIPNADKAGEVGVKTAVALKKKKEKKKHGDYMKETVRCSACGLCTQACPIGLNVRGMVRSIRSRYLRLHDVGGKTPEDIDSLKSTATTLLNENAYSPTELSEKLSVSRQYTYKILHELKGIHKIKKGKEMYYSLSRDAIKTLKTAGKDKKEEKPLSEEELMEGLYVCLFCGRCESWCPQKIPITSAYSQILKDKLSQQKGKIRAGRGAVQDVEIREVGRPIVFGEIPGVIAPVGCPSYPNGGQELVEIIKTFLDRNYIVTTSGCAAMTLGIEGGLYEQYDGIFDKGNLINTGSCVSNAHITGATVKIAKIFANRNINSNFEEIADYILNRVGAVGIAWGVHTQKAFAIAAGCNRLGIPVIVGPLGKKYRRELKSGEETDWSVYDTKNPGKYDVGPVPEHLFYVAETKEEAIVMAAKLCIRANDPPKGRMIKLAHWIDLHQKYYGGLPDDFHRFVREESDLPITKKKELLKELKKRGWKPVDKICDPTTVERLAGKN